MKKNIILIGNSWSVDSLYPILLEDYNVIRVNSTDELIENYENIFKNINAAVIDYPEAVRNNSEFLIKSQHDGRFAFLPLLMISNFPQDEKQLSCLSYGVVDFIAEPFQKTVIKNRIENAIKIRDSASFYEIERMLKALPSNIYLKDAEGRYIFATHYWHHLDHSDDPDWTIRGKTDVDIRKDTENAKMAMEKDMEVIRTGKGDSYIIEINADGILEYFQVYKEPVTDEKGNINGIIGLLNNVTEHEVMKRKLKSAAIIDGLTGLYNRKEIQSQIEKTICESRKKGSTCSVIMLDIDNFKQVNDFYGHKQGDIVIIGLADILKNNQTTSEKFSAGRWGGEEFMLLLHDTEISTATYIAELIRQCFANTTFPDIRPQTISLGVTQLRADDTADSLCIRVDDGLYKAKKQGKNRVCVV
ncbi:MAG: diguanylate cyclase [Ruminococcus sp.]|nr:diguanylate cyclase [Ruminococcus sp.]